MSPEQELMRGQWQTGTGRLSSANPPTTTPTYRGLSYDREVAQRMMGRPPSPPGFMGPGEEEYLQDLVLGFNPTSALVTTRILPDAMRKIVSSVPRDVRPAIRENLRTLVSAANQFVNEGPQHLPDRVEALKWALKLPNKISEKWAFLARSAISDAERMRLQKPLQEAVDWADNLVSYTFESAERPMGANLKAVGSKAWAEAGKGMPSSAPGKLIEGPKDVVSSLSKRPADPTKIKEWLKKIVDDPEVETKGVIDFKNLRLGAGAKRENVEQTAQRMLEIAKFEGGGIPKIKHQKDAIRYVLGFTSKLVENLQEARGWLADNVASKGTEQYKRIKGMVDEYEHAMNWATKLNQKALRPKK